MQPRLSRRMKNYFSRPQRIGAGALWVCLLIFAMGPGCALIDGTSGNSSPEADAGPDTSEPDLIGSACADDAQCSAASGPCSVATCEQGRCALSPATAGTVCRESAGGLCDEAQTCDGSSLDCPPPVASAAYCTLPRPIQYSGEGLNLKLDLVELDDNANTTAQVPPRASVKLRIKGSWSPTEPGDARNAQFYVGIADQTSTCLSYGPTENEFDETWEFDAPYETGTYVINLRARRDQRCDFTRSVSDASFRDNSLAVLVVAESGPPTLADMPLRVSLDAHNLVYNHISLDDTEARVATVSPGAEVALEVETKWRPYCMGCYAQAYVGMNNVFTQCLGSNDVSSVSKQHRTTFNAPTKPGVYIINSTSTEVYTTDCPDEPQVFPTHFDSNSVGTLIVKPAP